MQQFETVTFRTADGFDCNLKHLISEKPPSKGPVLLVHGAGVRADIFNPPTEKNLVTMLAEDGFDVWLENWRGSIDFEPNQWDLDKVALNDHPAAVKAVVEKTGAEKIKAIIHCQGSTSFMISAALGLVPNVELIISNAVSLHPVVPKFSNFKLKVFLPLVRLFFDYLNPHWGLNAPDLKSKIVKFLVRSTHFEKDTTVGKLVSFTYGAGHPALWRLENLDPAVKDWIQNEFAEVPVSFFRHISKCVSNGELVEFESPAGTTKNYTDDLKTSARIVLFGGELNLCFLAESQKQTFAYLNKIRPDFHKLYVLKKYSHLDVFLGKNAHKDVFPLMLTELNKD